jgi:hypothetical protein
MPDVGDREAEAIENMRFGEARMSRNSWSSAVRPERTSTNWAAEDALIERAADAGQLIERRHDASSSAILGVKASHKARVAS